MTQLLLTLVYPKPNSVPRCHSASLEPITDGHLSQRDRALRCNVVTTVNLAETFPDLPRPSASSEKFGNAWKSSAELC